MPGITLDLSDAIELAETLTFLADWLSGSQKQILADSFAVFVGDPAYNTGTLHADPGGSTWPISRPVSTGGRPARRRRVWTPRSGSRQPTR
jgi:hypothetical protein